MEEMGYLIINSQKFIEVGYHRENSIAQILMYLYTKPIKNMLEIMSEETKSCEAK